MSQPQNWHHTLKSNILFYLIILVYLSIIKSLKKLFLKAVSEDMILYALHNIFYN